MSPLLLIPAVLTSAGLAGAYFSAAPATPALRYLAFGAGGFDAVDNHSEQAELDLRAEYRFDNSLYRHGAVHVLPFLGLEMTGAGAIYPHGGLIAEVRRGSWTLSPGIAAGVYDNGSGRKLGSAIEFRSQFEIGYEWPNRHRVAAALAHISNADLGKQNPGVEVISLYYLYPLR